MSVLQKYFSGHFLQQLLPCSAGAAGTGAGSPAALPAGSTALPAFHSTSGCSLLQFSAELPPLTTALI